MSLKDIWYKAYGGQVGPPPNQPADMTLKVPAHYSDALSFALGVQQRKISPPGPKVVESVVGQEIVAWRGWALNADSLRLVSLHHPVQWHGPVLTADKVPEENSPHGIYALAKDKWFSDGGGFAATYRQMYLQMNIYGGICPSVAPYTNEYRDRSLVEGEVALSGVVVCGDKGYRAERATIQSLKLLKVPEECRLCKVEVAGWLEQRYQCPVTY
jgi:hypothetical protein